MDEGTGIRLSAEWLWEYREPIGKWLYVMSKGRLLEFMTRLAFFNILEYAHRISTLLGCQKYVFQPDRFVSPREYE